MMGKTCFKEGILTYESCTRLSDPDRHRQGHALARERPPLGVRLRRRREPDESECENGALVDVVSEKGKYLGTGFLSRLSKLRVRIVSRNANDRFDENFWRRRVRYAWDYRKAVMDGQTGCCRLIFGEADAFPGLTVDRFENLLVTQTLSLGMEKIKDMLFPSLSRCWSRTARRSTAFLSATMSCFAKRRA